MKISFSILFLLLLFKVKSQCCFSQSNCYIINSNLTCNHFFDNGNTIYIIVQLILIIQYLV